MICPGGSIVEEQEQNNIDPRSNYDSNRVAGGFIRLTIFPQTVQFKTAD